MKTGNLGYNWCLFRASETEEQRADSEVLEASFFVSVARFLLSVLWDFNVYFALWKWQEICANQPTNVSATYLALRNLITYLAEKSLHDCTSLEKQNENDCSYKTAAREDKSSLSRWQHCNLVPGEEGKQVVQKLSDWIWVAQSISRREVGSQRKTERGEEGQNTNRKRELPW